MSEAALSSSTGRVIRERCALVPTRPGNFINRVINADCLDVLPRLPSRSVDFVLTELAAARLQKRAKGNRMSSRQGSASR